jgi:hypothetical protein
MKIVPFVSLFCITCILSFSSCETDDVDPQGIEEVVGGVVLPPLTGFIINEVLYDPPSGDNVGDANGDGVRDANDDEFIEFYNGTADALDISGYKITIDNGGADSLDRHIFPAGTIIPSAKALVLFGGGTLTGLFGNSLAQTASSGSLNLNNSGEIITVYDTSGVLVVTFDINPLSGNPDESYTRNPDLTGDFVQHSDVGTLLFSPGTRNDGTSF